VGGVVKATTTSWTDREAMYALTTNSHDGDTTVTFTWGNYPTEQRVIQARHVRDVFLEGDDSYEPATAEPAFRNGIPVSVRLLGDPQPANVRPQYLVDATLSISDERMHEVTWDRYYLWTNAGSHVIDVTADSIGTRQLAFDTMSEPTSLLPTVVGEPVDGGTTRVCFHGYRDGREVISTVEIDSPVTDNAVRIAPKNCATVTWQGITHRTLTARAHGNVATVDLTLP
jgi:hypothetical protein